ncbi:type II secretion system protein [Phenylobacterium sp.]|jgi:prepilin-type N-terminal cleavage/methylation domain-containing protein|uniref:type II secretion system protein n=1 Tax=Phenylobacterium sp. TaxID=1871053 RepID=UPI0037C96653
MKRRGFTLVELLVVVSIILVLMTLIGGAVSGARSSQKKQSTKALIAKLDTIIQQQYATYATRTVARTATGVLGGVARRQMASGDMPDSWDEVKTLKDGTTGLASSPDRKFPLTAAQRAYAEYREALGPTAQFEGAECLFMIVMLGGLTDCLDCGGLSLSEKGDKDGDKAPEFWDAWGNPIGFVLWPAGLELPPGGGTKFFSTTSPFSGAAIASAPGGLMRPLIYSSGPDGKATFGEPAASHIKTHVNCGNPVDPTVAMFGAFVPPSDDPMDRRADNITNFDAEVGR